MGTLPPLLPSPSSTGRPRNDRRKTLNGILWILRTGAPWRELPSEYGAGASVAGRFYTWQKQGVWTQILQALQQQADAAGQLDWDVHHSDGSVIRAHPHAAGAKRGNGLPLFQDTRGG